MTKVLTSSNKSKRKPPNIQFTDSAISLFPIRHVSTGSGLASPFWREQTGGCQKKSGTGRQSRSRCGS